jgi:hypothetical protein
MEAMRDPYEVMLTKRIEASCPGLNSLKDIASAGEDVGVVVLRHVLSAACGCTHAAGIMNARTRIAEIPPEWLLLHVDQAVVGAVNLEDEWDYRRLLEVIERYCPSKLPHYVSVGLQSKDPEILEAAQAFLDQSK